MERAKKYLNNLDSIKANIYIVQSQIDELKANYGIGAIQSGDRVKTSANNHQIVRPAVEMVSLEEELDTLFNQKARIEGQIKRVENPTERLLISGVYMYRKSLTRMAQEIGYSYAHTKNLHQKALENFEKQFLN